MVSRNTVSLAIAVLFLGVLFIGEGTGIAQTKPPTVKVAPVSRSQPSSGKQMFKDYCSSCHGMDGKGNQAAYPFLAAQPPDLTTIAQRYNEKSVLQQVQFVLRYGNGSKAHEKLDMPLWRDLFRGLDSRSGSIAVSELRVYALSEYVQSIQKK